MIPRLLDPTCLITLLSGIGLALGSGPAFRHPARRVRYGIRLAWAAWVALFALSTPRLSTALAYAVEAEPVDVGAAVAAVPVDRRALVVLGAGFRGTDVAVPPEARLTPNGMARLMGAATLYREHGFGEVVVSGTDGSETPRALAEAMASVLVRLGVPRERIILEPWSRTTRENAHYSAMVLEGLAMEAIVVVTDAVHIPRSLAEFERQGVTAIGAPVAHEGRPPELVYGMLPSSGGLVLTHRVLHEVFGMVKPKWADPSPRWGGGPPPDWDPKAPLRLEGT